MTDKPDKNDLDDLMGLDEGGGEAAKERLHPILSDKDFLAAQAKARQWLDADRRAAAMAAVETQELERLRVEEGLTTGIDNEDVIVGFTVDLPLYAPSIVLNRRPYWHGRHYDVPLHVARTLSDEQWKAWRHDDQIDGKSIAQRLMQKRNTMINGRTGSVERAPVSFNA